MLLLVASLASACDPAAWTDACVDWWLDRVYREGHYTFETLGRHPDRHGGRGP